MNTDESKPSSVSGKEAPIKYVRTFAGDMAMLKSGGEPDLAPLDESQPAMVAVVGETEAAAPTPVVITESAAEPSVLPPLPPAPTPWIAPMPEQEDFSKLSPIETYTDDFSKRLKETKASTATLLAAEQDSRQEAPELFVSDEKQGNRWYIAAGVLLLVLGGVGVYVGYSRYVATTSPVATAPHVSSPIFVDSNETISGTGTALISALQQSVAKPLPSNAIRLVALASSTTTPTSVFAALGLQVPDAIIRNVDPAGSMAGVVNTISGQSPFFILSVGSYGVTFSGMLSWEPSMAKALSALFPAYPAPVAPTSIVATTTSNAARTSSVVTTTTVAAPVTSVPSGSFSDEVVSNHDVRIYRDAAGHSVLLYGYWNQSILVIARDPTAFAEILRRLATPHS